MRLLCLNDSKFDKSNDQVSNFLKANPADIICVQEVVRQLEDSVDPELISYQTICDATPRNSYSFFAPNEIISNFYLNSFHGHAQFKHEFGGFVETGLLTRSVYPIVNGKHIFPQNQLTYITDWSNFPQEDCKGIQVTELSIPPDKKLRILNHHGIWSQDKKGNNRTLITCQKIKELALAGNCPTIICGDFNLFPDTPSIQIFNQDLVNLIDKHHVKSTRPESNELNHLERNVVDYIFTSKGIIIDSFQVLQADGLDHLPLSLEFHL